MYSGTRSKVQAVTEFNPMADSARETRGLSSTLQFRPWPIWDPVPWLIDTLDKGQLIEISRIQLQLYRENLTAHLKAADAIEKVLRS
jgi:hypothetical protein